MSSLQYVGKPQRQRFRWSGRPPTVLDGVDTKPRKPRGPSPRLQRHKKANRKARANETAIYFPSPTLPPLGAEIGRPCILACTAILLCNTPGRIFLSPGQIIRATDSSSRVLTTMDRTSPTVLLSERPWPPLLLMRLGKGEPAYPPPLARPPLAEASMEPARGRSVSPVAKTFGCHSVYRDPPAVCSSLAELGQNLVAGPRTEDG